MKVRLERIEDLVGLLASLVEDLPQISTGMFTIHKSSSRSCQAGSVLDDPDIAFDRILAAQNPMPIIKQLPAGQLIQVATHARSRLEQAVLEAQNEIKVELEVRFRTPASIQTDLNSLHVPSVWFAAFGWCASATLLPATNHSSALAC